MANRLTKHAINLALFKQLKAYCVKVMKNMNMSDFIDF